MLSSKRTLAVLEGPYLSGMSQHNARGFLSPEPIVNFSQALQILTLAF